MQQWRSVYSLIVQLCIQHAILWKNFLKLKHGRDIPLGSAVGELVGGGGGGAFTRTITMCMSCANDIFHG